MSESEIEERKALGKLIAAQDMELGSSKRGNPVSNLTEKSLAQIYGIAYEKYIAIHDLPHMAKIYALEAVSDHITARLQPCLSEEIRQLDMKNVLFVSEASLKDAELQKCQGEVEELRLDVENLKSRDRIFQMAIDQKEGQLAQLRALLAKAIPYVDNATVLNGVNGQKVATELLAKISSEIGD